MWQVILVFIAMTAGQVRDLHATHDGSTILAFSVRRSSIFIAPCPELVFPASTKSWDEKRDKLAVLTLFLCWLGYVPRAARSCTTCSLP